MRWLQTYVFNKYKVTSTAVEVWPKKRAGNYPLVLQLWSFVGNKKNKQWVWLGLDTETKEIVGVYVGERNRNGASGLWQSLPGLYRQCAVCYTDFKGCLR